MWAPPPATQKLEHPSGAASSVDRALSLCGGCILSSTRRCFRSYIVALTKIMRACCFVSTSEPSLMAHHLGRFQVTFSGTGVPDLDSKRFSVKPLSSFQLTLSASESSLDTSMGDLEDLHRFLSINKSISPGPEILFRTNGRNSPINSLFCGHRRNECHCSGVSDHI